MVNIPSNLCFTKGKPPKVCWGTDTFNGSGGGGLVIKSCPTLNCLKKKSLDKSIDYKSIFHEESQLIILVKN